MIPFIRSLSELRIITNSRDQAKNFPQDNNSLSLTEDSGQRKRYLRSINEDVIKLPNISKKAIRKWERSKYAVSKFLDNLDYHNQIQSSYDITLLTRQDNYNHKDVA